MLVRCALCAERMTDALLPQELLQSPPRSGCIGMRRPDPFLAMASRTAMELVTRLWRRGPSTSLDWRSAGAQACFDGEHDYCAVAERVGATGGAPQQCVEHRRRDDFGLFAGRFILQWLGWGGKIAREGGLAGFPFEAARLCPCQRVCVL